MDSVERAVARSLVPQRRTQSQTAQPRKVPLAADRGWYEGLSSLASVERFIRQLLGWKEFVRGNSWRLMPDYGDRNTFGAGQPYALDVAYANGGVMASKPCVASAAQEKAGIRERAGRVRKYCRVSVKR